MNRNNLLIICLLLSLGVNLFFIGGIISRTMARPDLGARPLPPTLGWMLRGLNDERRAELSSLQQSSIEQIRSYRRNMSAKQERVNALMIAEPIDPVAISSAFAELRASYQDYQQVSHQQTIDMLSQLTETERQQALEFLRDRRFREGGERRPRGGPGGRPIVRPDPDRPR